MPLRRGLSTVGAQFNPHHKPVSWVLLGGQEEGLSRTQVTRGWAWELGRGEGPGRWFSWTTLGKENPAGVEGLGFVVASVGCYFHPSTQPGSSDLRCSRVEGSGHPQWCS